MPKYIFICHSSAGDGSVDLFHLFQGRLEVLSFAKVHSIHFINVHRPIAHKQKKEKIQNKWSQIHYLHTLQNWFHQGPLRAASPPHMNMCIMGYDCSPVPSSSNENDPHIILARHFPECLRRKAVFCGLQATARHTLHSYLYLSWKWVRRACCIIVISHNVFPSSSQPLGL